MTVAVNGVFDICHLLHIKLLRYAYKLKCDCNDKLIVGINSDQSVKQIKGESRPINNEKDRKEFLELLGFIDKVIIFNEPTAVEFLKEVKPDIWVKGGDRNMDTLDKEEKDIVLSNGGKIVFFDYMNGYSTTNLIDKIKKQVNL